MQRLRSAEVWMARMFASRESWETVGGIQLVTHIAKGQNPTAVSTVFEFLAKDTAKKEIILILDEVFDNPSRQRRLLGFMIQIMNS